MPDCLLAGITKLTAANSVQLLVGMENDCGSNYTGPCSGFPKHSSRRRAQTLLALLRRCSVNKGGKITNKMYLLMTGFFLKKIIPSPAKETIPDGLINEKTFTNI